MRASHGNTKEQREALKDALPMRCDAAWFRATFLEDTCPPKLGPQDDIWSLRAAIFTMRQLSSNTGK